MANTTLNIGTVYVGTIDGATNGSVITATSLPPGFTINSIARTWRYDGTGNTFIGDVTLTESLSNAVNNPRASVIGLSLVSLLAFSTMPVINTDGSPSVNEVSLFDFGTVVNGYVQSSRLIRTDTNTIILTDASIGSFKWDSIGTYALEVTAYNPASGAVKVVQSAPIVVAPASEVTLVKPNLVRTANTAAGVNPPELTVSWNDGGIDRNTDIIQYQYTRTGAYTGNNAITDFPLASSDGLNYLDEFKVITGADLPAGPFKAHARIKRNKGSNAFDYSDWSDDYIDTLNTASLPPAVTVWGRTANLVYNGPFGAPTFSTDGRTVRIGEYKAIGSGTSVIGRTAYAEINIALEGGNTDYYGNIGVADARQLPMQIYNNNGDNYGQTQHTGWVSPSGEVGFNGPRYPNPTIKYGHGDKIGILTTPIYTSGTQTGSTVAFYKNGTLYVSFDTDIIETYITAAATAGVYALLTLNAGQETFATANMQQFQWG